MKLGFKFVVAGVMVLGIADADAQNYTWTGTANGTWSDGANWSSGAPPAGGGTDHKLVFQPSATYATDNDLAGQFILNRLEFDAGTVTLTGNGLQFFSNGATTPAITNKAAIVVQINNDIDLANNMTVGSAADGVTYLNGAISGTGGLTNIGPATATIVLTGNNTYSGETIARVGATTGLAWTGLVLSNTTGGVSVPGNLKIIANAVVRLGASEQIADAAVVDVAGRWALLGRTETIAGLTGSGFLESVEQFDDKNVFGTSTLILNPAEGNVYRFSGYIRGGYGALTEDLIEVVKNGAGTQILQGGNIGTDGKFTGLQVNAGTLVLSNTTHASFSTPIDIAGSGKLVLESTSDAARNPVTNNVANGLAFGAAAEYTVGSLSGAGGVELKNRANAAVALTIGASDLSGVYSGDLSGDGSLIKAGTGTLTLSGNNTYLGTTLVTSGTLLVTKAAALPGYDSAGKVTVAGTLALNVGGAGWTSGELGTLIANTAFAAGGRLSLDLTTDISLSTALSMPGGLIKNGAGALTLSGDSTMGGATTINAGEVRVEHNNALGTSAVTLFGGVLKATVANLTTPNNIALSGGAIEVSNNWTLSGVISGTGKLTKTGATTLTLANVANTYSGGTEIFGGVLIAGGGGSLGSIAGNIVIDGGALHTIAGTGNNSFGNTVRIGGDGAVFFADTGSQLRLNGLVVDLPDASGVVRVQGLGTGLVLFNVANTYSGGTIIELGAEAVISGANGFGVGSLTFDGGRVRTTQGSGALTIPNNVILTGDAILGDASNSNPLNFIGDVTLSGGIRTVRIERSASTFSGIIGDGGGVYGLIKDGTVDLILGGQNTYTGITRVMAGTLALTNDASLASVVRLTLLYIWRFWP